MLGEDLTDSIFRSPILLNVFICLPNIFWHWRHLLPFCQMPLFWERPGLLLFSTSGAPLNFPHLGQKLELWLVAKLNQVREAAVVLGRPI